MKYADKLKVLGYLNNHWENSDEFDEVIRIMTEACTYADCECNNVTTADLVNYPNQDTLRKWLGKNEGEKYIISDCEKIAAAISELIADEFAENLHSALYAILPSEIN